MCRGRRVIDQVQGVKWQSVKMRLRTHGTIPPLCHMFSWHTQRQMCSLILCRMYRIYMGLKLVFFYCFGYLIIQVLISIQSLILVAEPYFNEPCYEIMLGTASGKQCSQSYNEDVLLHTILYGMVAQLRDPSSGFEDVIRTHFWIKKKRILTV
jgi:hypothetical protein